MELVCLFCLMRPKDEDSDNDDRLLVYNGYSVCVDHVPKMQEHMKREQRASIRREKERLKKAAQRER